MGLNLGDEQKKRIFSLLRQSAIFRGLDDNSISLILRCARPKQFEKDQMLFDDGDLGDFMLIVLRGRIGIMKGGFLVGEVKPPGLFGEIAFLLRSARTAAAQALDRCYCLEIQYREVNLLFNKKMVDEFLIKRNLIGILSDKLSQSNQSLIEVIGNRDTLLSDLKATLSKSKEVGPLEYFEEDIDFMNSRLQVFSQHERHSEIRAEDRYNIPFDIPSYIFVDNLGAILKLENLSKQGFSVFSSQHEALSIGDKIGGKLMFHTRRPIHFKAQLRWVESDRFGCEIRKLNDEKGFESFMDLLLEGNRN